MFDIRRYKDSDYSTFQKWIKDYGWGDIPANALAPIGIVAFESISNIPVAMGFLYKIENCDMCFMDFVAADPEFPATKRIRATQLVINRIIALSKELTNNKGWIVSLSSNKAYIRIAQTQGFKLAEENVQTIFYPLDNNPNSVGFLCDDKE